MIWRTAFLALPAIWLPLGVALAQQTADDYIKVGNACAAKSDWKNAEADFTLAVQRDAKDTAAYAGRAMAELWRGQNSEAFADLNRAIELNPKDSWSFINRAKVNLARYDYDHALADATQAITLDATNGEAFHIRAVAKLKSADFDGAAADFSKALELDPDNKEIFAECGDLQKRRPGQAPFFALSTLDDVPEVDHVKQKIDPADIDVDGSAIITIIIKDTSDVQGISHTVSSNFVLPEVDGLNFYSNGTSNSTEIVNGKGTNSETASFIVHAQRPGDFTIPGFTVQQEGKTYHVQAMSLHVRASGSAPASPSPPTTSPSPDPFPVPYPAAPTNPPALSSRSGVD